MGITNQNFYNTRYISLSLSPSFCLIFLVAECPSFIIFQGAANRKVAATNMNRASSRSHSVFTCIIESKVSSYLLSPLFTKISPPFIYDCEVSPINSSFISSLFLYLTKCLFLVGISRSDSSSVCSA